MFAATVLTLCQLCLREGAVSGCRCSDVPSSLSPSLLHALDKKADCTITMADSDLLALMTGKMNPQSVSTGSDADGADICRTPLSWVLEEPEIVPTLSAEETDL